MLGILERREEYPDSLSVIAALLVQVCEAFREAGLI
jgi:hypothetical protein